MLGHKSKFLPVGLGLVMETAKKFQSSLGIGKRWPSMQVGMAVIKAGVGWHAADLIIEHAIRAKGGDPVSPLRHQVMPLCTGGADGGKKLFTEFF